MRKSREAFVMPAIMIVGTVLFLVLAYALNATASAKGIITTSHAQTLARQAAESGIAYAKSCIISNNRMVTWSDDRPLKPDTDCFGYPIPELPVYDPVTGSQIGVDPPPPPYLVQTDTMRSYFEVYPSDINDKYKNVAALGKLDMLRKGTDHVLREYHHRMSAYVTTGVTFNDIAFGSIYGYGTNLLETDPNPKTQMGVYFFTKTVAGVVQGVGSNHDEVLRGWNSRGTKGNFYYPDPDLPGVDLPPNVRIEKIFTDFQGAGWNAYLLSSDNRVFVTGVNGNALMGNGLNSGGEPIYLPNWYAMTEMQIPDGEIVDTIYPNGSVTYILMQSRNLYVVGRNWKDGSISYGIAGCGDQCPSWDYVNTPTRVSFAESFGGTQTIDKKIVKVATDTMYYGNRTSSYAITEDGEVYGWGSNDCGQLGYGYSGIGGGWPYDYGCVSGSTAYLNGKYIPYGIKIGTFGSGGLRAIDIQTDGRSVWVVSNQGKVYTVGNNQYGQLARKTSKDYSYTIDVAKLASNPKEITKVVADSYSALFLTDKGEVIGVGMNDVGQIGNDANKNDSFNGGKKVKLDGNEKVADIFITSPPVFLNSPTGYPQYDWMYRARRFRNGYFVTVDGKVYGAGSNYYGQLGNHLSGCPRYGTDVDKKDKPVLMDIPSNFKAREVRSGIGTTIIITDKNDVLTVGNNHHGQLGDGTTNNNCTPAAHQYTNRYKTWYY
ncbi:MAG: RCC1 domain-containing protein [Candidatus Nanosyncoccaceae bacterium]|jgi:alpha-tubulin suppressor-like RCC1 family protein